MAKFENYNPDIDPTYGSDEPPLTYGDFTEPTKEPQRKKPASRSGLRSKKNLKTKSASAQTGNALDSARNLASGVKAFFADGRTRAAIGLAALLFGAYLLICFISFVTDGLHDQSQIEHLGIGSAGHVQNMGGEGGARLSQFLINDTFGLASLMIIIWLAGMAMKQFGLVRFKSVNFTIKCLVALITTSLIIGLVTIGVESHFMWGGAHGYYINQTIIQFIGWYGAALLCLLLVVVFFLICLYDIYRYFKGIYDRRHAARLARQEAERKQRELERRIAEMQALEDEKENLSEVERLSALEEGGLTFQSQDLPEADTKLEQDPQSLSSESDTDTLEHKESDDEWPEDNDEQSLDLRKEGEAASLNQNEDTGGSEASATTVGEGENLMTVTVNEIGKAGEGPVPQQPAAPSDEYDPRLDLPRYEFPSTELLIEGASHISVDEEEQLENQDKIRTILANFGIEITDIKATVGPTVTLYEIKLEQGIRINKVRNLGDDIALSLAAKGVRIIAPIPGRGTVGIEVANKDPQTVSMRTIIESRKYHECKYELPIALGSTIDNQVYIADLAKMPHLLVAGATGQGKSVGLNAMIASLLYRKHPAELKFVLVDPKMVEFSLYRALENYYLAKIEGEEDAVITRPEKVVATLSSLCVEMDARYELLKAAGVRNIKEYNAKFKKRVLNPEKGHKFMPYIVVVVDEFADLIMTAGKEVETPIARLAQKARAIGIHVILATQRPSANVITGVIKANFPARIAFKVSSGIDSKTILDCTGAQQLIGRGDMLISNNSELERVQCAFIDTPEVTAICNHIASQQGYSSAMILPEPVIGDPDGGASAGGNNFGDRDELFDEIARLIVTSNTASTSSLQRRYSIGYNRAGKIMDQLEAAGIVGPAQGGKPRQVLVDPVTLESILGSL